MILKLGMNHQGLKVYKVHINDDPGFTLTYFTARSDLVKLLCLSQTNSQVSIFWTIGPLVEDVGSILVLGCPSSVCPCEHQSIQELFKLW